MAATDMAAKASPRSLKLLLVFGASVTFMETLIYAAIAPLIPELTRELSLSTTQVGVLYAAYPAASILVSVPVGYAAGHFGSRVIAILGLWLMAVGSVGMAFGTSVAVLDVSRFFQGAGSAAAWTGALAWLAAAYDAEERGAGMGRAFSAAFLGTLIGPGLGWIASSAGRGVTFATVAAIFALLGVWGGPAQVATGHRERGPASLRTLARQGMMVGFVGMAALGAISGAAGAFGSLLLSDRGLGAGPIAACFVAASIPQVLLTSAIGRRVARTGAARFCSAMMLAAALLLTATALVHASVPSAALLSLAVAAGFSMYNPVMLLVSTTAEKLKGSQELAMSLAAGAAGIGATAGGLILAQVADVTSVAGALVGAAVVALATSATLAAAVRSGVTGDAGIAAEPAPVPVADC
jgi:predicted MFS family arabinose efflux permease